MRVSLIKPNNVINLDLPLNYGGSFWLEDRNEKGNTRKLINIEWKYNSWIAKSNYDCKLIKNKQEAEELRLEPFSFISLKVSNEDNFFYLYCNPIENETFLKLYINKNEEFTLGSDSLDKICIKNNLIMKNQFKLKYDGIKWGLIINDLKGLVFLNNIRIKENSISINNGDILFLYGARIIFIGNMIAIGYPKKFIEYDKNLFSEYQSTSINLNSIISNENPDENVEFFKKEDYFFRGPRFRTSFEKEKINIDAPVEKEREQDMPLIYEVGPMLTMGLTACVTGITTLNSILTKKQTLSSGLPSLVIAGAMLMSMIFWPLLSKKFRKKQKKKREQLRQERYKKYIQDKKDFINTTINNQSQILIENNFSDKECYDIILKKNRNLWERKIVHDDFLKIRLGLGPLKPDIDLTCPENHFSLYDDNLKDLISEVKDEVKIMNNVPICVNFTEKITSAIIAKKELSQKFINSLLLKICCNHSYNDLKIVIFTNKENSSYWEYLKMSPYCWDENNTIRYFCEDNDENTQICNFLYNEFLNRKYIDGDQSKINNLDYKSYMPYYLILTDDFSSIRNFDFIKEIISTKNNYGFSLIINNERLIGLPDECSLFINVDKKSSGLFENELISNKQQSFVPDLIEDNMFMDYVQLLANIPIESDKEKYSLPNTISFLEMYNVGTVEQLNIKKRWNNNNTLTSMKAPVGVNENGDLFYLDIHEKFHGPHGLVAGMTGSGKSEFIITYILSLAVNYHPDDVSFAIIDYKGGGLAGAFENKETGVVLPHLVGTMTNLDTIELNRSISSIESELKRRQKLFNEAREKLNESTIDIYKYQKLYHDGKIDTPIPHLLIISDEFAELKTQQSEFMENLISIARIGRSLGVHLILATQKPSGVVDDQIWSNSKFRVCLKVQDKIDSNEMIKCSNAASIKNVGRFYLQVGYNEYFALGQSAWCGMPYYRNEKISKKVDTDICFVNNIGYPIKSVNDIKEEKQISYGEELTNIVKTLSDTALELKLNRQKLWLDRIPEYIYIENLANKYNYKYSNNVSAIIGEYDNPGNQSQHLLTLSLTDSGNVIIYGASGSGKENLISTLLYSTITNYDVDDINYYIIDCGSEFLKCYEKAPHVGDVIFANDTEKINNLFKFIKTNLEERKKLFSNYGGDYISYKNSNNKIPLICIVLNYYETFAELYPDFEEKIISLTRDSSKYGIIFMITVNNANGVRYKLSQNFKHTIVLQMNEKNDYTTIFGNVNGVYPSKIKGRGLINNGNVYEFQTAYICEPENVLTKITDTIMELKEKYSSSAKKIPSLPSIVTIDDISDKLKSLEEIPIGIEKEELEISMYNFKDKMINQISSLDIEYAKGFINELATELSLLENNRMIVIDLEGLYDKNLERTVCVNKDIEQNYSKIKDYISSLSKSNNKIECVVFIIGLVKFKEKITKEELNNLFDSSKTSDNVTYIVVDSIDNFKTCTYDEWYKSYISTNQCIWIGDGLNEQFTIKLSKNPKYLKEEHGIKFGYNVKFGNPILIKLLGQKGDNNE